MCSCIYLPFVDYCSKVYRNENVDSIFQGDSTMARLRTNIESGCRRSLASAAATDLPQKGEHRSNASHHSSPFLLQRKVAVLNEATLHYLYLPFARESDRAAQATVGGSPNFLVQNTRSTEDFFTHLSRSVGDFYMQHDGPNTVFVYMANDIVCPEAYVNEYRDSWRFLRERLNARVIQNVTDRRQSDLASSLGFTLDYYGSKFASHMAVEYVAHSFPDFLILKMSQDHYPAICLLTTTGDGRHYSEIYYIVKARILFHLIGRRLHM